MTKKDISFDKSAKKYDNGIMGKFSARFYKNLTEAVELKKDFKVLDVGCGTGTVLKRLSEKEQIIGFGIDISEPMLDEARAKCPDMVFKIGDSALLPFENDSFDVITTSLAYHHFASQKKFREEALRVLKPCGKLYVCDMRLFAPVGEVINRLQETSNENSRLYKPEQLREQFAQSGFSFCNQIVDRYVQLLVVKK